MIGGFLGAGKTTTILRLAEYYRAQGRRVAIVTNDQASDLVDTLLLRSQGFDVGEVAGACFCCSFNELTTVMQSVSEDARPDVILAEPVGSCTDLVATVLRPLQQLYRRPLHLAPYGVIIKPSHGFKILGGNGGGFSPKAEYIFRKQLEEADFIIINRVDQLSEAQQHQISQMLGQQFPGLPLLRCSAKSGQGLDALLRRVDSSERDWGRPLELDYDIYAEGEAELGWLNCQLQLRGDQPIEIDELLLSLLEQLRQALLQESAEVAHLKAIAVVDGGHAVANVISSDQPAVLSLASELQQNSVGLVINARVGVAPERLEQLVRAVLAGQAEARQLRAELTAIQSLRPGRPVPTHRLVDREGP